VTKGFLGHTIELILDYLNYNYLSTKKLHFLTTLNKNLTFSLST